MESQQLKQFVKDKIDDMKGRDVIELDVRGKSSITDTMIICSGNSKRHVSSIAENVMVEAKNAGHAPGSVEGKARGGGRQGKGRTSSVEQTPLTPL